MAGNGARFLLRPVVKDANNKNGPNIDLISELKAANGKESLKRVKHQNKVEETESLIGGTDSETEAEPKSFWKQLQKRSASPAPSEDVVGDQDVLGLPVPGWKRLIMARQLAEKAQAAADELIKIEEEKNKYKDVPAWKRALLEKKEQEAKKREENGTKMAMQKEVAEGLTSESKEFKKAPAVLLKQIPNRKNTAGTDRQQSREVDKNANLQNILERFENLENSKKTEKAAMAPWQLELRKRTIFKDGFV